MNCISRSFGVSGLHPRIGLGLWVLGGLLACGRGDSGGIDRRYRPAFTESHTTVGIDGVCLQPGGAMVVSGSFQSVNGIATGPVIQLQPGGELDPGFQPPPAVSRCLATLPGGRLLAVGSRIVSLDWTGQADGRIDAPASYSYCSSCTEVSAAAAFPDGSVLVAGRALPLEPGESWLVRFRPDGQRDPHFRPPAMADVRVDDMAVDGLGRMLLAGRFWVPTEPGPRFLLRLDAAGALDPTFQPVLPVSDLNPGGWGPLPLRLLVQPDGRLVVAPTGTDPVSPSHRLLARLLPDGGLDDTFEPRLEAENVTALALQDDGQILVAASPFTSWPCRSQNLYRLRADGSRDARFAPEFKARRCPGNTIAQVVADRDRIVVVGPFNRVNGEPARGVAVLNADGTTRLAPLLDFASLGEANAVAVDDSGRALVRGSFTALSGRSVTNFVRLRPDGRLDDSFAVRDQDLLGMTDGRLVSLPGGGALVYGKAPPILRLLPSGARDPSFVFPDHLVNSQTRLVAATPDPQGRTLLLTVSNINLAVHRLLPDGTLDPAFRTFSHIDSQPRGSMPPTLITQDATGHLLLGGDPFTNLYRGVLRLAPDGLRDASFGPPPMTPGRISAMAAASDGLIAVGLMASPWLVRLSTDGQTLGGPGGLPPWPASFKPYALTHLAFDRKGRLYLGAQAAGSARVLRLSPAWEWDPTFALECAGGFSMCLSPDGDWLYVAGATEVNGVRSGGLLRVSTLDTPRLEVLGASPESGAQLRFHAEPDHWYRLETSADLKTWQPFLEFPFAQPTASLVDASAAAEPVRFYRLLVAPSP